MCSRVGNDLASAASVRCVVMSDSQGMRDHSPPDVVALTCEQSQASQDGDQPTEALVSVIIPTNRKSPFLVEALDSVVAQTYPHWEIILVDDGLPNAQWLAGIASAYPSTVIIRIQPSGPSVARNTGVARSRGSLVAFLDDDDVWPEDWLQAHADMHRLHPDVILTYGGTRSIDEDGTESHRDPSRHIADAGAVFRREVAILGATTVVKREDLLRLGGFSPSFRQAEDLDLAYRVAERSLPMHVPGPLYGYRRHVSNSTRNYRDLVHAIDQVIDVHIYVASAAGRQDWVDDHVVGRAANTRFALWSAWRSMKMNLKAGDITDAAKDCLWAMRFVPRAPMAWGIKVRQQYRARNR